MAKLNRRDFLKLLGITTAAGSLPLLYRHANARMPSISKDFYKVPMKGNARILHITDVHGQLNPVYFREPNVNLGIGDAFGRPPHIVGKKFLNTMKLQADTPESYAYTYLDFEKGAKKYGRMGGFAHIKTLLDSLRNEAGDRSN
ncbi:MAG: twin-arginine translocation signal domain-containing protein, partial [Gammaproteobacteria bacterium]|nr:twin-arginine translocation signal domain-containing protein [Gammaproteobacteria bacterium]